MKNNTYSVALLVISVLAFVLHIGISDAQEAEVGPITERILERGSLICGVNQVLEGFGFANEEGEFSGFDVDFCRAIAAAVLGDADAVTFRPLISTERPTVFQDGETDIMIRNTTWTISRDATWNAIFGPTIFYDGQGVMTRREFGVFSIIELEGSSICVEDGTTTELNIKDFVATNDLRLRVQVYPDQATTWASYLDGDCESWTTDKSALAAFRNTLENPREHFILPETLSKEPLGPLVPQSDPQFAEIMTWTIYGMIQAEEFGISSENVQDFLDSDNASIQRLLGTNNNDAGNYLGLDNQFMVTVLEQVGNYGEVYERNLASLGLTREGSLNALWTNGGLIYAPPFR